MFNAVYCAFIKLFNMFIDYIFETIVDVLGFVIDLLPGIPLLSEPLHWGNFGNAIGYFIPVSTMLTHFSMMLGILGLYHGVEYLLRIFKLIK